MPQPFHGRNPERATDFLPCAGNPEKNGATADGPTTATPAASGVSPAGVFPFAPTHNQSLMELP
jgi:hypothetical protein